MDDLISRQAAIARINKQREHLKPALFEQDDIGDMAYRICAEFISRLPSAERHARWEHLGGDEWFCTVCGHVITTEGSWEKPWQKYCEECGAKMEGER